MDCFRVRSLSPQVNGAFPFRCRGHGSPSLSLLNVLSPNIHPNAEALWEKEIPPILTLLEGTNQTHPMGEYTGLLTSGVSLNSTSERRGRERRAVRLRYRRLKQARLEYRKAFSQTRFNETH